MYRNVLKGKLETEANYEHVLLLQSEILNFMYGRTATIEKWWEFPQYYELKLLIPSWSIQCRPSSYSQYDVGIEKEKGRKEQMFM